VTTQSGGRGRADDGRRRADGEAGGSSGAERPGELSDPATGENARQSWESACACPGPCLRDHELD